MPTLRRVSTGRVVPDASGATSRCRREIRRGRCLYIDQFPGGRLSLKNLIMKSSNHLQFSLLYGASALAAAEAPETIKPLSLPADEPRMVTRNMPRMELRDPGREALSPDELKRYDAAVAAVAKHPEVVAAAEAVKAADAECKRLMAARDSDAAQGAARVAWLKAMETLRAKQREHLLKTSDDIRALEAKKQAAYAAFKPDFKAPPPNPPQPKAEAEVPQKADAASVPPVAPATQAGVSDKGAAPGKAQ